MHELFASVGCDFGRKSIDFKSIEDEKEKQLIMMQLEKRKLTKN